MRRLWDLRPPEFIALSPADRTRVWHRCYFRSLRRPKMIIPLILLGVSMVMVMMLMQMIIGPPSSRWGMVARYGMIGVAQIVLMFAFAQYAVYVVRDELRACATGCCLNCWYDLTGNESGVCPECGTARVGKTDNVRASGLP